MARERVYIRSLLRFSASKPLVERRVMFVPTLRHLLDERFVPRIERSRLPYPPLRLRMVRVSASTLVLREDVPKPVELTVLA